MLIDDGEYGAWVRVGKLRQLFESTVAEPEKRKCLNGLHFPDPLAGLEGGLHASDVLALRRTRDELGCPRTFDSSDVAFRLVATQGAFHMPHVDNCGDATWVYVVTGEKVWFFLEPRNTFDLSANDLWTSHSLDMSSLDLSKWHVRAVLLTAGTKMCALIATYLFPRSAVNQSSVGSSLQACLTPSTPKNIPFASEATSCPAGPSSESSQG